MAFGAEGVLSNNISIWNVATAKEILRLYLVGASADSSALDWIAVTPEGYYDASAEGEKRLRWREGLAFWPLEKSRGRFKNPAKIRAALAG